jgi:type 1 fimbriae regulatory protein FimB/type 1 fimbriae regulatory protein FimE
MMNKDLAKLPRVAGSPASKPVSEKRTVLRRLPNLDYRGREHLTADEVEQMIRAAAKSGRYGARDAAAILLAFRHGMRVSELCALRWDQVDMKAKQLHTNRVKGGLAAMHPLQADELKALRALAAQRASDSVYVLENERGGMLQPGAVRKIVKRAGRIAKLEIDTHPHMLRHAAGFALMKSKKDLRTIQEWLGHRSLASTARYTALDVDRFAGIWD